jgi:hypothetical protein
MKKYKFFVFVIFLVLALLCICAEPEYSLAADPSLPSLVGTFIGTLEDYSGRQGQLTIDITSDTTWYDGIMHYIEGTVTLAGFPECFSQGLFSGPYGYWLEYEGDYGGGTYNGFWGGLFHRRFGV